MCTGWPGSIPAKPCSLTHAPSPTTRRSQVEAKIRAAEAVFIAGGDQANYVNFWKDTRVEDALNYLRNTKQCPIGGTSAGNTIMGCYYYSTLNNTIVSTAALINPYDPNIATSRNDFLDNPFLGNTITDDHFNNPDRRGRLVTFLARMSNENSIVLRGVGIDEAPAVCIEPSGVSKIFGTGTAFFLQQNGSSTPPPPSAAFRVAPSIGTAAGRPCRCTRPSAPLRAKTPSTSVLGAVAVAAYNIIASTAACSASPIESNISVKRKGKLTSFPFLCLSPPVFLGLRVQLARAENGK